MFGYVFPDKPELKIKEFELFRSYYCGLCKTIGDNCGQLARFLLNYDSAFLAFLLSSFYDKPETMRLEKCMSHPFVKKPMVRESSAMDYASDINILLAYYKLKDDFDDKKSPIPLGAMGVFHSAFKKALNRNMEKGNIIKDRLNELSELEKKNCSSMDEAAEPFAKLTEEIFAYEPLCEEEKNSKLLRLLGYNTGKWIYIIDAYDDIENDIKHKNFNPILNQFCYNNEKVDEFKNKIKENISFTLIYTLSQCGRALELMEIKKNREILENIIYGGMHKKTLQILDKRSCSINEKSV